MADKARWRRRIAGGAVVGLVGLGLWMGMHFKGPGLGGGGTGGGTGAATGDDTNSGGDLVGDDLQATASAGAARTASQSTAKTAGLVRVVIDGARLLVVDAAGDVRETPIQDVCALVQESGGDSQGLRVRIERTKTATKGAEHELLTGLEAAGVPREAIQQATDYLDAPPQ